MAMTVRLVSVIAVAAALSPAAAFAYIGPGAGISAIGTALALIAAVLLAIVGFIWYPIKRLLAGRRKTPTAAPTASPAPKDGQ